MTYDPYDIDITQVDDCYKFEIAGFFIRTVDYLFDLQCKNLIDAEQLLAAIRENGNIEIGKNRIIANSEIGWYLIHSLYQNMAVRQM